MKSYSAYLLFLSFLLLFSSCKKSDNPSPETPKKETTCLITSYGDPNSTYLYSYSYNSDTLISSYTYKSSSTTTTKNYTYTFDSEGRVSKKDAGNGNYSIYEYEGDRVSEIKTYSSYNYSFFTEIMNYTDRITITRYPIIADGPIYHQPIDMLDYTFLGENIVKLKEVRYFSGSDVIAQEKETSYSNFDNKLSKNYRLSLSDPSFVAVSKNNPGKYTSSEKVYGPHGDLIANLSQIGVITYTYNSNGAVIMTVESRDETIHGNTSSSTYTENFTYSHCN